MTPWLLHDRIDLAARGLTLAPSQVLGGVRLVPVLRRDVRADLRLAKRSYGDDAMVVSLDGEPRAPGTKYVSFVPHGLVVSWSDDGSPTAAWGAELHAKDGRRIGKGPATVRLAHRMVRREEPKQLRFLPLHLAMEGFLALHFGGPEMAWPEYSREVLRRGLSPRYEYAYGGAAVSGLDDALRLFEIHDDQVGVLLFVADALASAFVVPTPEDYRALHRSLLEDFYGELIVQYGYYASENAGVAEARIDERTVSSLADLRGALTTMRADWAAFHAAMTEGLLENPLQAKALYQAGPFHLQRFMTDLDLDRENHIGEAIVREDGALEYLKTFRLSAAQSRRAFLLSKLADHGWKLDDAARALACTKDELVRRFVDAGFGYMFAPAVLQAAQRR